MSLRGTKLQQSSGTGGGAAGGVHPTSWQMARHVEAGSVASGASLLKLNHMEIVCDDSLSWQPAPNQAETVLLLEYEALDLLAA